MQMQMQMKKSPTSIRSARFSLKPAFSAPSSYVEDWHSTARTCAVLVVLVTAIHSCPIAAVRLLLLIFAEIVSFTLALILVSYDAYVAFCHRAR